MSRKEREWDPVLAKFRDPVREDALKTKEVTQQGERRKVAVARQLRLGQKWNIINNQLLTDLPRKNVKPKRPDSLMPYNILNNVPRVREPQLKMVPRGAEYDPWYRASLGG